MDRITVLGNGSWSSALVKILTDKGNTVNWWMRDQEACSHIKEHGHNPHYLNSVEFDIEKLNLFTDIDEAISVGKVLLIGIPSAFVKDVLAQSDKTLLTGRKIVSAVKGILPDEHLLLNDYLIKEYNLAPENYFCITGPCHAEEIAEEKLSYLTFSGANEAETVDLAKRFETGYLKTVISNDIQGVQYAAVMKNIYALGAGIAYGLDYGDNFISVFITNCFAELQNFMNLVATEQQHHYNTGAYLGDLLVTCYSLHSRNRTFGNYIGKGYSVKSAQLELNMIAEGYYASKGIQEITSKMDIHMPIAESIYRILWHQAGAKKEFGALHDMFK